MLNILYALDFVQPFLFPTTETFVLFGMKYLLKLIDVNHVLFLNNYNFYENLKKL